MEFSRGVSSVAERSARELATRLGKRKTLLLFLFTVVYFTGAVLKARGEPLWFDEVFTTTIAGLRLPAMWTALSRGADGNPPLSYILVRAAESTFGPGEVTARLPSMIGFWTFCLCLFGFTLRRTGIYYALSAMLIPFVTPAYHYAVQARPYGMILGFCGAALICWQMAADGMWRRLTVPLLGMSLAAALFSHYYAILLYGPFAGAEMFRAIRRRKTDWAVWLAMVAALVALLVCSPLIEAARQYVGHPWAPPHVGDFMRFYEIIFKHTLLPLALLLAAVAAYVVMPREDSERDAGELTAPGHEIVAGVLLLFLPAPALAMAFAATGIYTERYALSAVAGFAIVSVFAACGISGGRAVSGALMLLVSGMCFLGGLAHVGRFQNPLDREPLLRETLEREPVAVSDGLLFLQVWHYAPTSMKAHLFYVASPELAVAYTGADTVERNLLSLSGWGNIPVVEYESFANSGREFLIYQNEAIGWLVPRLLDGGASFRLEKWTRNRGLLRVRVGH